MWDKAPYNRLKKSGIRNAMKEVGKNMDCKVYPHKLRKTLGVNLKDKGTDIGIIQEVMGHANPTVTSRYYAQISPEAMRDVRRRTA